MSEPGYINNNGSVLVSYEGLIKGKGNVILFHISNIFNEGKANLIASSKAIFYIVQNPPRG